MQPPHLGIGKPSANYAQYLKMLLPPIVATLRRPSEKNNQTTFV